MKETIDSFGIENAIEKTRAQIERAKEMGYAHGCGPIRLKSTGQIGSFAGLNEISGGMRPGSMYPVLVNFIGRPLEYSLDEIELVEEIEKAK